MRLTQEPCVITLLRVVALHAVSPTPEATAHRVQIMEVAEATAAVAVLAVAAVQEAVAVVVVNLFHLLTKTSLL